MMSNSKTEMMTPNRACSCRVQCFELAGAARECKSSRRRDSKSAVACSEATWPTVVALVTAELEVMNKFQVTVYKNFKCMNTIKARSR